MIYRIILNDNNNIYNLDVKTSDLFKYINDNNINIENIVKIYKYN